MADAGGIQHSYRAFISYAHADARVVARLHRTLERFRVPRALVGREGLAGPVPRRLAPIFRDREELPASGSLTARLEEALASSMFLVVACSPAAASSHWTNVEVETFLALHGPERILAIIVGGEADLPMRALFPPALAALSPIAADARPGKDGERGAFLKVAAGLAGVGLDDLVRREAQRRVRVAATVTGASLIAAAGAGALAFVAVDARREAESQRDSAEGLIEFMLTDLRKRLEPVGRLDVLDSVGARALEHYRAQRGGVTDPDALGRRARALILIGEVANQRGDSAAALAAFQEAAAATAELLADAPNDGERIYNHHLATFWVGYVAWERRDLAAAHEAFEENLALSTRLVAIDPANREWQRELASSYANLGVLLLDEGKPGEAITLLEQARALTLAIGPDDPETLLEVANNDGWLASAHGQLGQLAEQAAARRRGLDLLERIDPEGRNLTVQEMRTVALNALAANAFAGGRHAEAQAAVDTARALGDRLLTVDPDNVFWRQQHVSTLALAARIAAARGNQLQAREAAGQALAEAIAVARQDPDNLIWRYRVWVSAVTARASLPLSPEARAELLRMIDGALATPAAPDASREELLARARLLESRALLAGDAETRRQDFAAADATLAHPMFAADSNAHLLRARVVHCLGNSSAARTFLTDLRAKGYRTVEMETLASDLATGGRRSCTASG